MAKVIINIPNGQMQKFLRLVSQLGVEKYSTEVKKSIPKYRKRSIQSIKPKSAGQLSFFVTNNWELYRNELEFE